MNMRMTAELNEKSSVPRGIAKRKKRINWVLYFMIAPAVILTLIYQYGPMLGLSIAFQSYDLSKGLYGSQWVGLDNFKYIFMLPGFNQVIFNTVWISVMKLLLQMMVPLTVALMMNEVFNNRYKRVIQTSVYLPNFISWIIVAGLMRDMLSPSSGIINQVIQFFGFEPIMFLADKTWFPIIMVLSDAWKDFGFGTIIYMAALTQIDPNLYEAAVVDGASRWKRMLHITFPGIIHVVVLVFILKLGFIVQNAGFDQIVNLYSPAVYETGDILDTMIFRIAFESSVPQYDIATAIGMMKSVVSLMLVSISYYVAYKVADYRVF